MRPWLLLVVVAACGSKAPPPPASTAAPPVQPPATVAPRPVSCGEVGVILRGPVEDEFSAGPLQEAAIARACLHDRWGEDVIACVGGRRRPRACLEALTPAQRKGYNDKLIAWNDEFPDETVDEYLEGAAPDPDDDVDCQRGIGNVARYAPPLPATGDDVAVATALRRMRVTVLCDDWSTEVRRCFANGNQPAACRPLLEPDQEHGLVAGLAEADALMGRISTVRKRPADFACKRVVAVHYGDAAWKGKLDGLAPRERRKAIAASRAQLQQACVAETWSPALRACLVAGGGEQCFDATGEVSGLAWGYPTGLVAKTGIPECDAYHATVLALARCPKMPPAAAKSMLDAVRLAAAAPAGPPAQRPAQAAACKQAELAIRQSASSLGCKL